MKYETITYETPEKGIVVYFRTAPALLRAIIKVSEIGIAAESPDDVKILIHRSIHTDRLSPKQQQH